MLLSYEIVRDAPFNSREGVGVMEFSEKIFPPSKITLPLHRFIKEHISRFHPIFDCDVTYIDEILFLETM